MTPTHPDTLLRPMVSTDLPTVLETEASCYPDPWSQKTFADCLAAQAKGYRCYVLLLDGRVIGHTVLSLILGEAELLNFCLTPSQQGKGLASVYLESVLMTMAGQGANKLFLEVRQSNTPAQRLYTSAGMHQIGRRKDYYPSGGGREDAILMGIEWQFA